MRKSISIILVLSLVLSLFPFGQAVRAYDEDFVFDSATGTITGYIGPGGYVEIPSSINGYGVTRIGHGAFDSCNQITGVSIPSSVESIGTYPFILCSNLTTIEVDSANQYYSSENGVLFNKNKTMLLQYPNGKNGTYVIPNTVTSLGWSAFAYSTGLAGITIPNSIAIISDGAFEGCTSLNNVIIPYGVTTVDMCAFSACTSLTDITIPGSVTRIDDTALPYDTGITVYTYAGSYAESFAIERNFSVSHTLIPTEFEFNSATGTITGYSGIGGEVWIPSAINGVSVSKIGSMAFEDKSSITGIHIPDSITSIGYAAFGSCTELTEIFIPSSVESISGYPFIFCPKLTDIEVDSANQYYSSENGVLFNKDKTTLLQYPNGKNGTYVIPNTVTSLGMSSFAYSTKLTEITIPSSITVIRNGAFEGCTGLGYVVIPESVTTLENYAFADCTGLTGIEIPDTVTSIADIAPLPDGTNLTIYTYIGSYAESYAIENNIPVNYFLDTYGGSWTGAKGIYNATAGYGNKAAIKNSNYTNFEYSADVKAGASGSYGEAGLIFRASDLMVGMDSLKGYYVGIDIINNWVLLGKFNNNWTALASATPAPGESFDADTYYNVKVVASGENIKVYINGNENPVIDCEDGSYPSGEVGFRVFGTNGQFRNVSVTEMTAPSLVITSPAQNSIVSDNGDFTLEWEPAATNASITINGEVVASGVTGTTANLNLPYTGELAVVISEEGRGSAQIKLKRNPITTYVTEGGVEYICVNGVNMGLKLQSSLLEENGVAVISSENLNRFVGHLDKAYMDYYDLVGDKPFNGDRIIIKSANLSPNIGAYAGNPIQWNQLYVTDNLKSINDNDDWNYGILHEIGHNFDIRSGWNWDAEYWANLKMGYVLMQNPDSKVSGHNKWYYGNQMCDYYRDFTGTDSYAYAIQNKVFNYGLLTVRMLEMPLNIGFEPLKATFRHYINTNENPASKLDKFNRFVELLQYYYDEQNPNSSGTEVEDTFQTFEPNIKELDVIREGLSPSDLVAYEGQWKATGSGSDRAYSVNSGYGNKAEIKNSEYSNFEYSADVKTSSGEAGIFFRADDINYGTDSLRGYYACIVFANNRASKVMLGKHNYNWSLIAEAAAPDTVTQNAYHTIKVVADDNVIQVYADGVKVIERTDNTYSSGALGFRMLGSDGVLYKNVSITQIAGPTPPPTPSSEILLYSEDFESAASIEDVEGITNISSAVYSIINNGTRKYLKMSKGSGDYANAAAFDLLFNPVRVSSGNMSTPVPDIINPGSNAVIRVQYDIRAIESSSSNRAAGVSVSGINGTGEVRDAGLLYHYGMSGTAAYTYGKPAAAGTGTIPAGFLDKYAINPVTSGKWYTVKVEIPVTNHSGQYIAGQNNINVYVDGVLTDIQNAPFISSWALVLDRIRVKEVNFYANSPTDTNEGFCIDDISVKLISVDKNALAVKIAEANSLHAAASANVGTGGGQYTQAKVSALSDAIAAAQNIYNKAAASQEEVNLAVSDLQDAIDACTPNPVDKSGLAAKLADANDLYATVSANIGTNPGQYTAAKAAALAAAIQSAQNVYDDAGATQAEIDSATADLQTAIDACTPVPERETIAIFADDFESYQNSAELQASGWTHTYNISSVVLGTTSTKFAQIKSGQANSYGQFIFTPVALNENGGASLGSNVKLVAEYRVARNYFASGNASWASFTDSSKAARAETLGAGTRMDSAPHASNTGLFRYASYIGSGHQGFASIYTAPSGVNTTAENNIWVKIKYVVSITDESGEYIEPSVDIYVNDSATPVLAGRPLQNVSDKIDAIRIGHSSSQINMSIGVDDINVYVTRDMGE